MLFGLIVATSLPIISNPGQPHRTALAETMARHTD